MRDVGPLVAAIDQGTSSTRFIIFSANDGTLITYHQREVKRFYPQEGWVEQDPCELFNSVLETIDVAVDKLDQLQIDPTGIQCIGLTNQRESVIIWDRITGEPLYNCIVWLDNRTSDIVDSVLDNIPGRDLNWLKKKTGLPISTYFSAFKLKWLIKHQPVVRDAIAAGRALFGTVDSWILWKLTDGAVHATDVTNASRTLLMDLETLSWDVDLCRFFGIPLSILPRIEPSSHWYGTVSVSNCVMAGVPITGIIGDQNAALVGQQCFGVGQAKVTYGTGCFLIQNIGHGPLHSALARGVSAEARKQLIITVAYQFGSDLPPCYALEGSVAIAGAAITWLRDNLELVQNYAEVERIAREDPLGSGGLYFVPALQGLYAPYWDANATGTIIGVSQFSRKCHLVRATLEGVAFQANDILSMMMSTPSLLTMQKTNNKENDEEEDEEACIKVDGGMSSNDLLCQILADISGRCIVRPKITEATALGAAMIAGYTIQLWPELNDRIRQYHNSTTSSPRTSIVNHDDNHQNIDGVDGNSGIVDHIPGLSTLIQHTTNIMQQTTRRLSISSNCSTSSTKVTLMTRSTTSVEECALFVQKYDRFEPTLIEQLRVKKIEQWKAAVQRSRKWIRIETQEARKRDYRRLSALPLMLFVLLSFGTHIISCGADSGSGLFAK